VLIDALVIWVRKDESVVPVAVLIATGITSEGQREILGLMLVDSENEASWNAMLEDLKGRGFSNDHKGLKKAVRSTFRESDGNAARCIFSRRFWVMRRPPREDPCPKPCPGCLARRRWKKPGLRKKLPSPWNAWRTDSMSHDRSGLSQ